MIETSEALDYYGHFPRFALALQHCPFYPGDSWLVGWLWFNDTFSTNRLHNTREHLKFVKKTLPCWTEKYSDHGRLIYKKLSRGVFCPGEFFPGGLSPRGIYSLLVWSTLQHFTSAVRQQTEHSHIALCCVDFVSQRFNCHPLHRHRRL